MIATPSRNQYSGVMFGLSWRTTWSMTFTLAPEWTRTAGDRMRVVQGRPV